MKKILGTVALVGTLLGTTASADMCSYYIQTATKQGTTANSYFVDIQDYQNGCIYLKMSLGSVINAVSECPKEFEQQLRDLVLTTNNNYKRLCK